MRIKAILLIAAILTVLSGCANTGGVQNSGQTTTQAGQTAAQTTAQTTAQATTQDVVSSASIVDNAAAFEKAISNTGTWIIAITRDVTVDKDIVLDGEFKNGKKDSAGKDIIQRKVALYAQDANRNITARYTLTAPKFTINSPEGSIQHGTFKGDLYVSAKDFKLIDATVDGNVYFTTDDAKNTFKADQTSKITGVQELKK
jgi:uncharacterized protein YceK